MMGERCEAINRIAIKVVAMLINLLGRVNAGLEIIRENEMGSGCFETW